MTVLVFSDLHGEKKHKKLLSFIKGETWDVAFGLGDFGSKFTATCYKDVIKLPRIYTIYGNHDNVDEIKSYSGWLKDGYHLIDGLNVFALNGVWGNRGLPYHITVPQILPLMTMECDLLITHEHPYGLSYNHHDGTFKFMEDHGWHEEFLNAVIKVLKPKLWLYGHSYTAEPDRNIRGIRTYGVDSRFVLFNEEWRAMRVENVAAVIF